MAPLTISPSSWPSTPEIAFRIVDLPAPFEPSNATMRAGRHFERDVAHRLDRSIIENPHVLERQHRGLTVAEEGGGESARRASIDGIRQGRRMLGQSAALPARAR